MPMKYVINSVTTSVNLFKSMAVKDWLDRCEKVIELSSKKKEKKLIEQFKKKCNFNVLSAIVNQADGQNSEPDQGNDH